MMKKIEFTHRLLEEDLIKILDSRNWEELQEYMQKLLEKLNVSNFLLHMEINSSAGNADCKLLSSLPISVSKFFFANEKPEKDLINCHLLQSSIPLPWQIEQLCGADSAEFYRQLKTQGITYGFSVAIRSKQAASRVDFYGENPDLFSFARSQNADAHLMAVYLHEAVLLLRNKTTAHQAPLFSARELECLQWSANGKTSHEIGLILGVSHHTVHFHLKNIARKLQVYGTRHAVSRALMLGVIKIH